MVCLVLCTLTSPSSKAYNPKPCLLVPVDWHVAGCQAEAARALNPWVAALHRRVQLRHMPAPVPRAVASFSRARMNCYTNLTAAPVHCLCIVHQICPSGHCAGSLVTRSRGWLPAYPILELHLAVSPQQLTRMRAHAASCLFDPIITVTCTSQAPSLPSRRPCG